MFYSCTKGKDRRNRTTSRTIEVPAKSVVPPEVTDNAAVASDSTFSTVSQFSSDMTPAKLLSGFRQHQIEKLTTKKKPPACKMSK